MKEKISEIFLWVFTIGLVLIVIFDRNITMVTMIAFLVIMCICCPGIHLIFYRKSKIKISSYKFLQYFLPLFSVIIAIYFTIFIIFRFKIEDLDVAKIVLKIFVYFIYFFIIAFVSTENKRKEYFIFGILYAICVLFSFIPSKFDENIARALNTVVVYQQMDKITYEYIIEAILTPIKEAVLTYIIFDTVFDSNAGSKKKEEKQCNKFKVIVEGGDNNKSKKEYLINIQNIINKKSNQPLND